MSPGIWLLAGATFAAAALLTAAVRHIAIRRGVLDVPNARSSHVTATPRGGGLAIVLSASAALLCLAFAGALPLRLAVVLVGGGGAVAAVGFADDHRPVAAGVRLAVHLLAAVWAVAWLGGFPEIALGPQTLYLGWIGNVVAVLGVMWVLNLFNFMDGIDGIAASEAVFVTGAVLPAMSVLGIPAAIGAASLIVGAAALGFLVWNWPPARIFMGDIGSGYVGYAIAALALACGGHNPTAVWVWLILGGVFFVDATVTLGRRLLRGERAHEAHRSHAYQWLARRWGSHGKVTLAVLVVNLVWLLPGALLAARFPGYAAVLVIVVLAPLAVLAVVIGSGREEGNTLRKINPT
jgi:Fuc2NAc and GlcNAc transferase